MRIEPPSFARARFWILRRRCSAWPTWNATPGKGLRKRARHVLFTRVAEVARASTSWGGGGLQFRKGTLCVTIHKKDCPFDEQLRHEISNFDKYYFLHFFIYIKIKISKILFTISYRCLRRINACKNVYSNITKWKSCILFEQKLFPFLDQFYCDAAWCAKRSQIELWRQ